MQSPGHLLLTILVLFTAFAPLYAQAPVGGSAAYVRPSLDAALFDTGAAGLSEAQIESLMQALGLVARNFTDSPAVTQRVRARALALALRLRPNDRMAVVANGQLARGVSPQPLPVPPGTTPATVAHTLVDLGIALTQVPENDGRRLGLLVLDLAVTIEPRLRRAVYPYNYLAVPDWQESAAPQAVPLEAPRTFTLRETEVKAVLSGLGENGALKVLTMQAKAVESSPNKPLQVDLPAPLMQAMTAKNGGELRERVGRTMTELHALLQSRHEGFPEGWTVQVTDSGGPPDGSPQFFAGLALMLDALLSGEPLDPGCLLAAGMDGKGNLMPAVPSGVLLKAARAMSPPPAVILSTRSAEEALDWLLLNPDQWQLFTVLQVHQATDLNSARYLCRSVHAERLAAALAGFHGVSVAVRDAADPLAELRKPENIASLRDVLTWHAGHVSAAALLRVAEPNGCVLSLRGSLARIDALALPILSTDRRKFPLHNKRGPLEKSVFIKAAEELQGAGRLLHPGAKTYAAEVIALGKLLDRAAGKWNAYLKNNGPPDPPDVSARRREVLSVRAELEERLR